ncbi:hypothetical protein ACJRO7_021967 [Eucalyptus globulus]|uniref:Uncharacterized protein n=1 Tax=Eucalyptus globulus TaxID=34317 RepID=A0ABD3KN60_EUCGL
MITALIQLTKPLKLSLINDPSATITKKLVEELSTRYGYTFTEPLLMDVTQKDRVLEPRLSPTSSIETMKKFYVILEAVEDRVEMHNNIGEQRDNWNKLLLNSVNMMTLTTTTTAAMAAAAPAPSLRLCSALLFTAAASLLWS